MEQVGLALEFDRGGKISVSYGKQSNQEWWVGRSRIAPEAWEGESRETGLRTGRAGNNK